MGYTHYWNFKNDTAPKDIENGEEKFAKAANLGARLCDKVRKRGIEICGGDGHFNPTFCAARVCFNGNAEKGEEHETFYIDTEDGAFNFCKTARKPYDLLVCLMLLAFKYYFKDDFEYSSDGVTRESIKEPESLEYWKSIGWEPKIEDEWETAYKVWEQVKAENGLTD